MKRLTALLVVACAGSAPPPRGPSGLPAAAISFEKMRRDDDLYKVGAVIRYNTDPVVPVRGSAIFLHAWGGRDAPTAGCVALAETDVRAILGWLDRRQNPVILLGRP